MALLPPRRAPLRSVLPAASLAALLALGACSHMGPGTVAVDRFDYSSAVADSWKQQTLLNIVKLRYMDLPVFVDVASIVAGYSLETGGSLGGQISSADAVQGNSVLLGATAKYTDRPTITYVPLTGERFLAGLVTPIDPKNIFSMLQSGYAADFILGLTVDSLNGVRNRSAVAGNIREADPEFIRVLQLMREIQAAGAVGMRVDEDKVKGRTAVLFMRRNDVAPEILAKQKELRTLLHLPEDRQHFILRYSPVRGENDELAVSSRSLLQIMTAFSSYIDVPQEHLDEHSALPTFQDGEANSSGSRIHIRSGKERPKHAYAAVPYRDYWYWIEDSDLAAKRALGAVMFFFTLAETGSSEKAPLVTIPAQ
ncbi:hypothetical protein ACA097_01410 [Pseudomonas sp. QL9]|uniref:Lipoprotein n=1 Tax=Pseudomonas knackmussii (strain DSM 6978 / CCUG 54928 / LMG 23759 / B13) TaxID=1301098 RepID=A0A024HGU0_PSEKB|nr:hypothetical protein [Pseudomonas knackmussii]CDF83653.1 hypothetical protein PKB_2306 [Pseudomonas knackmussii B13]